jgi:hypothetical protein
MGTVLAWFPIFIWRMSRYEQGARKCGLRIVGRLRECEAWSNLVYTSIISTSYARRIDGDCEAIMSTKVRN